MLEMRQIKASPSVGFEILDNSDHNFQYFSDLSQDIIKGRLTIVFEFVNTR